MKDAVITAIPSHCSKVMFKTCSKGKSTEVQNSVNSDNDEMVLTNISDEKMGFIMMECGFEGIAFKVCFCIINIMYSIYNKYCVDYNYVYIVIIRLLKDQTLKKRMIEKSEMYHHLRQHRQHPSLQLGKYRILKIDLKMKII